MSLSRQNTLLLGVCLGVEVQGHGMQGWMLSFNRPCWSSHLELILETPSCPLQLSLQKIHLPAPHCTGNRD